MVRTMQSIVFLAIFASLRLCGEALRLKQGGKPVDKPGSVVGNHSSRRTVASTLKQPTRKQREPRHALPYLALLQMGFAVPSVLPRPR
jgi:hypothetical protein